MRCADSPPEDLHPELYDLQIEPRPIASLKLRRNNPRTAQLAESLDDLAAELTRLASEAEQPGRAARPGRSIRASTQLALGLEALFWKPDIPMTERCRLIAAVVSAFVEPVSGEQIRQRIKDFRRRPPSR